MMEFLFWLGVQDRIIATGEAPTGLTFPEQFRAQAEQIEVIAEPFVPGKEYLGVPFEALLNKRPDFVVSDFTTTFVSFSQKDLAQRGIPSYLTLSNDCEGGFTSPRTDLRAVQQDIENLGRIFGVPDRAAELVDQMNAKVAEVATRVRDANRPTVLYLSGEFITADKPGSALGNRHVVNAILELAGAKNVFADVDAAYQTVGWEEMAARDPDIILIGSYGYGGQEDYDKIITSARKVLSTNPATRNLRAVAQGRMYDINGSLLGSANVRNADGVAAVARIVHPTAFP
jgi:iron complex transport system substrate-binding protein